MPAITSIKRFDLLILIVVLIVAGWMRLGRGNIVEYFHDDAMLSTLALEMADGEHFPLTGILSSTGIPNPPTSVYVMAIPFSVVADPTIAINFVMVLNVIGVGLLWFIAHRYWGRWIAIVASLTYAINPWAVLFSRKIWAQDFHTPFILLGIGLLFYGFWETSNSGWKKTIAQIISIPILLFAFQIHFASWAIAPIILVTLWYKRQQIIWRAMPIMLMLSALTLAPYLMGLTQTLDQDPTRISDAVGRSSAGGSLSLTAEPLIHMIQLSAGMGLESWVAPDQSEQLSALYPPLIQVGFILSIMMLVGAGIVWHKNRPLMLFLAIWAFLAQATLMFDITPIYIHYFIPSIPAMCLLMGIGIGSISQQLAHYPAVTGLIGIAVGIICIMQITLWHTVLDYLDTQHINYPGFTTPIRALNTIKSELNSTDDVIVISQGMSWNLHHEVAVWDTLLWDDVACVRTLVGDGYAVFPSHPFTILVAPDTPPDPINNLYQTDNPTHFDTRQGDNGYTLFEWETPPQWTRSSIQTIDPVTFDNGVQLTGYALEDEQVYLEWKLPAQHKGADYQYSAQLFDAESTRLAQLDKIFWHGRHWCEGDRLITWGTLPLSDSATTLTVGLYQLGTGKDIGQFFNANILDLQGNPIGQQVTLSLID